MVTENRQKEISVPTGKRYIIREQNGYDDEVLSQVTSVDDADVINRFMANIILKDSEGNTVYHEDVLKMPLRDKYTLLIQSRIFSLGAELKFEYDWGTNVPPQSYTDDLTQYVWDDYNSPFPAPGSPMYFKYRMPPYAPSVIEGVEFEVDGLKMKFNLLDGKGETYLLKLQAGNQNINQELIARNLSVYKEGWVKVVNFAGFTARQMSHIRAKIKQFDERIEVLTLIDHPFSGQTIEIPLIGIRDFFFPSLL